MVSNKYFKMKYFKLVVKKFLRNFGRFQGYFYTQKIKRKYEKSRIVAAEF